MSALQFKKCKCMKCNHVFEVTIHSSINLALDEELILPLLTLKLFEHECPKCKHINKVLHTVLVNDMYSTSPKFIYLTGNPKEKEVLEQIKTPTVWTEPTKEIYTELEPFIRRVYSIVKKSYADKDIIQEVSKFYNGELD